MPGTRTPRGGLVGAALFASVLMGVVAAGCEIAIGNDVPAFECVIEAAVCPGNQVCNPSSHQCVTPCSVTGCAGGMQCDAVLNVCVPGPTGDDGPVGGDDVTSSGGGDGDADATTTPDEAAPPVETGPGPDTGPCRGLTCPCSGAASCNSGICADSLTVPSGLYAAAGNQSFCTKPCCTSADCDTGTVCFATGAGGNFCVSPAWLQRSTIVGTSLGGATCGSGRDCRSGLCAGTTCADTCCSTGAAASECASGNQCRFGTFQGVASFDQNYVAYCGHGGTRGNGSTCSINSDCQSELCDGPDGCANACRNSGECASSGEACVYLIPNGVPSGAVAACASGSGGGLGNTAEGGNCTSDNECKSLTCDPTSLQCTDVCFADSDCTKAGWRCRPESVTLSGGGKFSVLICGT
jgi:hypothetical protein